MSPEIKALIDRYEAGAEVLAEAVEGIPAEILDRSPAPGKWSIRELVVHVADSEFVGGMRIRTFIAEPGKALMAMDQDKWAAALAYPKRSIPESLAVVRSIRRATASMLRLVPEAAWENTCTHEELGAITLRKYMEYFASHAAHHAEQVKGLRERMTTAA
jgi:hypothetical protein